MQKREQASEAPAAGAADCVRSCLVVEGPGELEPGERPSANLLQKDRGEREYQLEICLVERESG